MKPSIYFTLLILILGCSTAPEFDRDNPNDPKGDNFIPNRPNRPFYNFDEDGNITLVWSDNTQFETSYNIYKKIGERPYELAAVLPVNSVQYIDSTKEFGYPTSYRVVSAKDTLESNALTFGIDFGSMQSLEAELNRNLNNISLSWSASLRYKNGFLITRESDLITEEKFVTITSPEVNSIDVPIPEDGFSQEYRVFPFSVYEGDTTTLIPATLLLDVATPSALEQTLQSTDSLLVTWEDNSSFEDQFILSLEVNGITAIERQLPENTTQEIIEFDFQRNDVLRTKLRAVSNSLNSPTIGSNSISLTNIAPPTIVQSTVNNTAATVDLIVKENDSRFRREKEILRSSNNGPFNVIGVLQNSDSVFTDTNLDINTIYTYKVRADLSDDSPPLSLHFKPTLLPVITLPTNAGRAENIVYSKSRNKLIYVVERGGNPQKEINFLDLSSFNTSSIGLSLSRVQVLSMNEEGNKFIVYSPIGDIENLYLYDVDQEQLEEVITIPNLDNALDIVFLYNDESILINAQVNNPLNGALELKQLQYNFADNSITTLIENQIYYFQANYDTKKLVFYYFQPVDANNHILNIRRHTINNSSLEVLNGPTFRTNIGNSFRPLLTASPQMDTLIFPIPDRGFIRADLNQSAIIDEYNADISNAAYYKRDFTILQTSRGLSILDQSENGEQIVSQIDYNPFETFFGGDLLYLDDLNLVIDSQSNFGSQRLESFLRLFRIEEQWTEVIE